MLPHWTWPGREGEVTPVYVYTDYPEAELFVNGRSQGRIKKNAASRLDRYRLRWNEVRYEPGMVEVVAYDAEGREAARTRQVTAGEPVALQLVADRTVLKADGDDLAFVTVSLIDKDGTFCPMADDELTFSVTGAGVYQAACNGDATSLEPFTEPQMRLFSGQLVIVVRTTKVPGDIVLTVTDTKRGLSKSLTINSR
jgi:beta-galactosidase